MSERYFPGEKVRTTKYSRHPAFVTSDRLLAHVEKWHERFTPQERDALALVRSRLQDIAEQDTSGREDEQDGGAS